MATSVCPYYITNAPPCTTHIVKMSCKAKIKANADKYQGQLFRLGKNGAKLRYERSTGKAINAIFGALNDQELQRQSLNMNKVIDHAIKKNTKPGMAILVSEAMQKRGKDSVPLMFKTMFRQINSMTGHQFDLKQTS